MSNQTYIEKYKDQDEIIRTYFQVRDRYGRLENVDGIVSPLKGDNRQLASPTDQQGETPHCAAYSICNIVEAINWKRTGKICNLDADQVYAKAKLLDGDPDGEGTFLEYAIQAALNLGGFQNPGRIKVGFMYNDGKEGVGEAFKYLIHKYPCHIAYRHLLRRPRRSRSRIRPARRVHTELMGQGMGWQRFRNTAMGRVQAGIHVLLLPAELL